MWLASKIVTMCLCKGDVCKQLVEAYNFVQLSTVSTYRTSLSKGIAEAEEVKKALADKKSIPDESMSKLLGKRIQEEDCVSKGWFIDGYPRSQRQAELLTVENVKPRALICLNVPNQRIIEKVTQKRVDPDTHKMYHLTDNPPNNEEVVARLVQRAADTEERVKEQLGKYQEETEGLLKEWADILITVDGDKSADAVVADIREALKKRMDIILGD